MSWQVAINEEIQKIAWIILKVQDYLESWQVTPMVKHYKEPFSGI
jgi:hypothetical protein